jgi:hypothetical protein
MDCDVFDVLLDDLARDLPIDQTIRREGLDHASYCLECGNRLSEARSLTRGLRALAAADASAQPPLHLEGILLNAFEEAMKTNLRGRRLRLFSRPAVAWLGMAAAVAITAVGITMSLHRQRPVRVTEVVRSGDVKQPVAGERAQPDGQLQVEVKRQSEKPASGKAVEKPATRQEPGHAMPADARPQSNRPAHHVVWATDFVPLPYADNSTPLGHADIVRLTIPNSALASLGLPVGDDSSSKNVTADVLVGDDGMPRAISFVRL